MTLTSSAIINYLSATYVPQRAQFATFLTKAYRNFKNTATSRNESSHAELKATIRNRLADLYVLHEKIWEMTLKKSLAYKIKFVKQTNRRRSEWDKFPVVRHLVYRIGWHAMDQIIKQADIAMDDLQGRKRMPPCTGSFRAQWGLPCCHELERKVACNTPLFLFDVDVHWHLKLTTVR